MNKMKVENVLYWIGLAICLALFVASVVLAVKFNDVRMVIEGIPFMVYASLIFVIISKNREIKTHLIGGAGMVMVMGEMAKDLDRYKKLYGDLPKEEKKENEEEKEEQK
jgi:hypothetical protein